jgi:hypothetical protein
VAVATENSWSRFDRLAARRDADGAIVGRTNGDTACWFPREPGRFVTIGDDGREHVIRCRFCLGCREYERRILARRLAEHYSEVEGYLWLVIVRGTPRVISYLIPHLRRMTKSRSWRGFIRFGMDGFATVAVGGRPQLPAALTRMASSVVTEKVRRPQRAHAWRKATSGLLHSRDSSAKWTNRWYIRGLKHLERPVKFSRATRYTRGISKRHPAGAHSGSVRAWKDGITLHLPERIKLKRLHRRGGAVEQRVGGGLSKVEALIAGTVRAISFSVPAAKRRLLVLARERPHSQSGTPRSDSYREAGYSSSRQFSVGDLDVWAARMADLARSRDKPPDG